MGGPTGSELTINVGRVSAHQSPPPSTGGEPDTTERPTGPTLPQELLDNIWDQALMPWLKKRVVVVSYERATDAIPGGVHTDKLLVLVCKNALDHMAAELVRNIRLVDTKAKDNVSFSLRKANRNMFPESRDFARMLYHPSFRDQYVDFEHDVFWLSTSFLQARISLLFYPTTRERLEVVNQRIPQPSHMMLSLRHMLAIMEIVFLGQTRHIAHAHAASHFIGQDPCSAFHRVTRIHGNKPLRTVTVLVLQTIDEWNGDVDYDLLEHKPFSTSAEAKTSVLELATNPTNRVHLQKVLAHWLKLVKVAELNGWIAALPTLQFSSKVVAGPRSNTKTP